MDDLFVRLISETSEYRTLELKSNKENKAIYDYAGLLSILNSFPSKRFHHNALPQPIA